MLEHGSDDPLALIKTECKERLNSAHHKAKEQGKHFMGVERINKTSPYQRATSWEDLRVNRPICHLRRPSAKMGPVNGVSSIRPSPWVEGSMKRDNLLSKRSKHFGKRTERRSTCDAMETGSCNFPVEPGG